MDMDNRDLHFVDRYLPELSPLLLELDGAVLDKLSLWRLPPDTLLYQQEDWDESPLYVVVYGVCKLFCNYESLLFPIYCPRGCVIGTLEALSEDFVLRTANMSSFTEVVLLSIPRRLLQHEVYDQSRGLFFWLVRRTILKYHRSGLKYFVRGDVILKLCGYFCDVFAMCRTSTCGEVHSILIRDTQTRLANSTGASVRSVARSVSRMKELGLISTRRGGFLMDDGHYQKMQDFMRQQGF